MKRPTRYRVVVLTSPGPHLSQLSETTRGHRGRAYFLVRS